MGIPNALSPLPTPCYAIRFYVKRNGKLVLAAASVALGDSSAAGSLRDGDGVSLLRRSRALGNGLALSGLRSRSLALSGLLDGSSLLLDVGLDLAILHHHISVLILPTARNGTFIRGLLDLGRRAVAPVHASIY